MLRDNLGSLGVSTHSRPKAAGQYQVPYMYNSHIVSTHSRPKAAGPGMGKSVLMNYLFQHTAARRRLDKELARRFFAKGFNTQPPEGGWK